MTSYELVKNFKKSGLKAFGPIPLPACFDINLKQNMLLK
jgi:hypothetical protein